MTLGDIKNKNDNMPRLTLANLISGLTALLSCLCASDFTTKLILLFASTINLAFVAFDCLRYVSKHDKTGNDDVN